MENLLLLLPRRPQSLWVRYGTTTIIVLIFFLIRLGLEERAGTYGFFILLPSIFLSSVLFDRGSGFYATLLSVVLLLPVLPAGTDILSTLERHAVPLALFVIICLGIAALSEALRGALERALAAERTKDLLLRELGHRIKNNLAIVVSMLQMQARANPDGLSQEHVQAAIARVRVIGEAHGYLDPASRQGLVHMQDYLAELGRQLAETLRGLRPVAVNVQAEAIAMPAERAVVIGLIVNELITNAFKYAFDDDQPGIIDVQLRRVSDKQIVLTVADNGKGCPADAPRGFGRRLIDLMTQQLRGSYALEDVRKGCRVRVDIPHAGRCNKTGGP